MDKLLKVVVIELSMIVDKELHDVGDLDLNVDQIEQTYSTLV